MKLHLPKKLLCAVLTTFLGVANATTVTGPDSSYSYRGGDYIATETKATSTTTTLVVNLDKLKTSSQNCSSTAGASNNNYLLGWFTNSTTYGLVATDVGIKAAITAKIWDNASNVTLSYDTLLEYADADGNVSLTITNTHNNGVTIEYSNGSKSGNTKWGGLQYSSYNTTHKYYFNSSFVESVTLDNDSTRLDNLAPYIQKNEGAPSIGRVLFAGDSITHGINESTWRWQLFKTLTDNGIENEIAGPSQGYSTSHSYRTDGVQLNITSDAGQKEGLDVLTEQYGNATFSNTHLAQASGRVRNMLAGTSVNGGASYGGEWKAAGHVTEINNYDTVVCLIGTNDLLSDSGYSNDNLTNKIQTLLGGSVKNDDFTWSRTENDSWGTMGDLVNALLPDKKNDQLYLMTIPVWYKKIGDDDSLTRKAVKQYNENYAQWVESYNAAHGTNIKLVNINRGLEDVATNQYKGHLDFFYNDTDGLHPNEQGSLIIAGNLAQAMGIGGRTAGLERSDIDSAPSVWHSATVGTDGTIAAGSSLSVAENIFTQDGGYSVDFSASFGNGATDGWLAAAAAGMNITVGDGINSGTLSLSEGYIMWGGKVLYCQDTSSIGENLRVVWLNGNEDDNVLSGYYVWLGDMLIGQGLSANAADSALNGITISASGAAGNVTDFSWANMAYAPTTTLITSAEHAYRVAQTAGNSKLIVTSGVSYEGAATTNATNGAVLVTANTAKGTYTQILSSENAPTTQKTAWVGMVNTAFSDDINVQYTGNISATVFGAMNNGNGAGAGKLVLDVAAGSIIGTAGTYDNVKAAIAGSYGGGKADAFNVYINGGQLENNVVGGSISGAGSIGSVLIALNSGRIDGNIYGGSCDVIESGSPTDKVKAVANSVVGKAQIIVNGGEVTGDIVAGGTAGTIGNVDVLITDGTIGGNITKGAAKRQQGSTTNVTVVGNKASIGGNIEADTVTLQDVAASESSTGFDKYSNIITADKLVLNNVQADLGASVNVSEIMVSNSNTSLVMGDLATLESLTLNAGTTFGVFKAAESRAADTNSETTLSLSNLTVGKGATLNANIVLGKDSILSLEGCLTMGSSVALATGMTIDLSADLLTLLYQGETIDIFASVDSLTLDGLNIDKDSITEVNFSVDNMVQSFDMAYSNAGSVSITLVPEPTTATLSLLALAGLAARRRRK